MRLTRRVAFVPAAVVLVGGGVGGAAGHAAPGDAGATAAVGAPRLVPFRSCGDLLGYVKSQASPLVGPWGLGGASFARGGLPPGVAAPAAGATSDGETRTEGVDYSGTNVQEQGVDEPDLVRRTARLCSPSLAPAQRRRRHGDATAAARLAEARQWLEPRALLAGDRLLVLAGWVLADAPSGRDGDRDAVLPATSVLSEIDVSNPKALRLIRTLTLDGAYVDARLVGATARIVVSSQVPARLPFEQPTESTDAALALARDHNRAVARSSRLGSWLPTYRIKRAGRPAQAARPLVQCRSVDRPKRFSGLGMLTVLTVDLTRASTRWTRSA
jgi:hypothetical protein